MTLEGLIILVLIFVFFIHWITGTLAARKGYNFLLWFLGGGLLGLLILAFLPFTNKGDFPEAVAEQKRLTGNIIGGILAAFTIFGVLMRLSSGG